MFHISQMGFTTEAAYKKALILLAAACINLTRQAPGVIECVGSGSWTYDQNNLMTCSG